MAGRGRQWRKAALEAVLRGEDTVKCFNKTGKVSDWLTSEQIANASVEIKKYSEVKPSTRTPSPPKPKLPTEPEPPIPAKDTDYKPADDICFILANGESREKFDLNKLKGKGYIIGMNVLPIAQDFWPDALIAVDIPTVKYICEHEKKVPDRLEMWSYPRGGIKDPRVKRLSRDWGWSSGPTSTRIALEYKKYKTLYILGMDFFGKTADGDISEKNGRKLNNMFKGHARYRKAGSDRTYFGNWLNQMITNCASHPNAKFYHVVADNQKSPNKLAQKPNWIDINYSKFEEHLQKMPKKSP
jgi:hypothetical protein